MIFAFGFGPIGLFELLAIFVVVLLLFGAKKLPEVGSGLGKAIGNFRKTVKDGQNDDTKPTDSTS